MISLLANCLSYALSIFRANCFRCLRGLFLGRVGEKSRFFGWPSLGTYNGNVHIGRRNLVGRQVFFSAGKSCEIVIGDNCSLNTGCHLVAIYGITIGDGTRIGEYVSIRDQDHNFESLGESVEGQGYTGAPIAIGKNCWIGRGVFVGAGVTIGDGCVVGANAVVTKDLPPNSVAVGVPAKVIRQRA